MTKLTIIDFSSLLYSTCYNCSMNEEKTDNFEEYGNTLDFYVQSIFDDTEAEFYMAFGDDYVSFRKEEFKEFKADRANKPPMKFLSELKLYAIDRYGLILDKKLEADDMCLIANKILADKYSITIASKDADLRQTDGLFYNYGWRLPIYKKYKNSSEEPSEDELAEGLKNSFQRLGIGDAYLNLWIKVLIKGHNNKYHYLNRCGETTGTAYVKAFQKYDLGGMVLKAFIEGIEKNKEENIKLSVKGYGYLKGIDYFNKAFRQTYLLRTMEEVQLIGSEFEVPIPIEIDKKIDTDF